MLEGGPAERPLGEPHAGVAQQRLDVEKDSAEELRDEIGAEHDVISEEEFAEELAERSAEWREEYEAALEEEHAAALELVGQLQEDMEAAGIPLLALQQAFAEHESREWAPADVAAAKD
eukprot:5258943-Prymnesium_polylepis.1